MYLSKLEIFGFKSFAHKVNFQFNDGITAIIGPNGCGKSNIVDAIRWVLGEQRTSLLRLDKMENVIFNGTAVRKPLSMVEVSIHIENTKNILPSVYSEVKITRRLYRSGESEYLLNNRQVRLKDVIDLFVDTGMGSDAYSVIELKMVEQILSENADERRRLFEEAAGIMKYKFRRKSAMRKLETTDQELVRLSDVISEVQKTVNSLARQMGKARRYHQNKNEVEQKELFVFQLKNQASQQELVPLQQEYDQVRETRERLGKEVNRGEAELEKLQVKAVDLEDSFREVTARLNKSDEIVREIQQKVRLNEQKIDSHKQNIAEREKEIENQKNQIEELNKQLKLLGVEKENTVTEACEKERVYKQKALLQVGVESHLEEIRKKYQSFREENANILKKMSDRREAFQKIAVEINNLLQQQERLHISKQNFADNLKYKQQQLHQLETEMTAAHKDADRYQKEMNLLQEQVRELEGQIEPLQSGKNLLLGEIEKIKSRKEFLQNLIENYEGFSESVQYVMSHKKKYTGLIDTLANMVDTKEEYRTALESYLEEIANYLVVEGVETARSILDEIRNHKKGRLTLVPLSLLNTGRNGRPDLSHLNEETVVLKDIVKYDPRFEELFNFLFDRVILVKDIDAALRWHTEYPHFNFLTQDGELLGEWGNITGGNSRQGVNLTGRKRQFEKVETESVDLDKRLQAVDGELSSNREQSIEKVIKIEEFEKLLNEQQSTIAKLEQQFHQQKYEIDRLRESLEENQEELASVSQQLDDLSTKEAEMLPVVKETEHRQQEFHEEESRLNGEREAADQSLRKLVREVQELHIEYLKKENRVKELEQSLEFTKRRLDETLKRIDQTSAEIGNYRHEIELFEGENDNFHRQLDGLYKERDEIEKEKLEVENKYQGLKSVILTREDEIKKLHRRWNQSLERLKELELRIQEIDIRRKTQQEQFAEQFGGELEALLAENPVPDNLSLQQAQAEIATLRQRIESLGDVNPLAIKEHAKEKERLDFLKSQQSDLVEAREELLDTISRLNKTARKLFMDTFEKINKNFQIVFSKFFEGGEAELQLSENGDPLETNIGINVHIKGRRLATLNLLSAGEKTLTAISLLFAIYLYKPSPFCILDEVDAPLDDVNISRYTHALKEFSRNTQFILVTHNKMTMQAARSMYGITMEEPGVSKVVSVRFD